MKKAVAAFLAIMFVLAVAMSAHAVSAYTRIEMTPETKVIDDKTDQGPNNLPIGWYGDCAIGCTWIGDMVQLDDVDFGSQGASEVIITFTNGDPDIREIGLILDDPKSDPVTIIKCGQTAGWDKTKAKDFSAKIDKPITGTHTVYIKWLNGTGSLFAVTFKEAGSASTGSVTSPATGDNTLIIAAVSLLAALALAAFAIIPAKSAK